ncbi:MAG: OmpH family outer membrane protein [Bacteroidetes bacterium]|nr:OmpH family outer membrane protein [Bacteroidota bacterium]
MKKIFKIAAIILVVFGSFQVNAQGKNKLGHINSDSLLKMMPGRDSANTKIQTEVKSYESQIKTMQTELENKYTDFQTNLSTMSDLIKQTKQTELQDLQARIEKFQTSAQEALQKKQTELLQPIINKAKKAIDDVAKENGFSYILDAAPGTILYYDGGEDILPLVKKKLGIK